MWLLILILNGIMTFSSQSQCILLNKNINFNKNETESKTENLTYSFRETNFVLQLIQESQIKSKSMMIWASRKKKARIFCTVYFFRRFFTVYVFNIVLHQRIVYWIHFQNIHTFTYEKTLFHTLLLLVFRIVESLPCILHTKNTGNFDVLWLILNKCATYCSVISIANFENIFIC